MTDKSYLIDSATRIQKSTYICLNPYCKDPNNRFVTIFDYHFKNNGCSKWAVQTGVMNESILKTKKKQNTPLMQIPLGEQPIECAMNYAGLKNLCTQKLRTFMDEVTHKISETLKTVWQVLNTKIDTYFQPFEQIFTEITQIVNQKDISWQRINNFVTSAQMKKVYLSEDIVILSQMKQIQQKIQCSLSQITEKLICSKQYLNRDIGISLSEKDNMSKYLKDNSDDHTKKMAKISGLLKVDQKLLYERKNKNVHQSFSYNSYNYQNQFIVKCPICMYNFSTQKKKQLMALWNSLIQHLYTGHLQEIGYAYEHLISGNAIYQTCIEEIIYKMTEYSYESLQFIYKNGRKNYSFHYSNKNKFSVQVISKNQTCQLPIKFMYLSQFSQFYCLLGTVAYTLQNNMKSKSKTIIVYINTPSQVSLIRKLNDMLNLKNIQMIYERRSQQNSNSYQDEVLEGQQKDNLNVSFNFNIQNNNGPKEQMFEELKTSQ